MGCEFVVKRGSKQVLRVCLFGRKRKEGKENKRDESSSWKRDQNKFLGSVCLEGGGGGGKQTWDASSS